MTRYTIGIDLGGTTMTAGLVDENYRILDKITWATNLPRPAEDLEQSMVELCRELTAKNNLALSDIAWVGIGTPGSVDSSTGVVGYNANFGYHNWQLGADLEKLMGCKVYVENDANAAAYGEYVAGGAKGAKTAVCITLGTGVGSGIILDGKIYSGANHAGGEMGHTVIVMGGRPCNCGRCGCWERYAAARALTEDTQEAMRANPDNMMWGLVGHDITKTNAKTAFDAMKAGDALGKQVVDQWTQAVACGIVNVINTFQPEIVCIGGGVSKEGELLLAPIRAYMDREDFNRAGSGRTELKTAVLRNDAGVVGAAALGSQQ